MRKGNGFLPKSFNGQNSHSNDVGKTILALEDSSIHSCK